MARNIPISAAIIFLVVFFSPAIAGAQDGQPKLRLEVSAQKVIRGEQNGKLIESLQPAENTRTGDILRYTVTYTNVGESTATGASIVDPIPAGTVYLPDSIPADGNQILLSIDGGAFFQTPPAFYTVQRADGSIEKIPAPPEMVTHIKWQLKDAVSPGGSGRLMFEVRVK